MKPRRGYRPQRDPEAQEQGALLVQAMRRKRQRYTLALDLGTTSGWAMWSGVTLTSGSLKLAPGRHESSGMRFVKFEHSLRELLPGVGQVVYEEVARHAGTHAAHVYGGFVGILANVCHHSDIEYAGVPVGTIKKHATGKGNAGKPLMVEASNRIIGMRNGNLFCEPVTDDNEADAICLLDYWLVNCT